MASLKIRNHCSATSHLMRADDDYDDDEPRAALIHQGARQGAPQKTAQN